MQITFHGAAQTVTGSQHMLEINGRQLLLECGLAQGKRAEAERLNRELPFDPAQLEAVIVTHAHIDHCGNLPSLVKNGYERPIFTTHVSAHLIGLMLADSAHIQEADAEYMNRKHARRGEALIRPLYSREEAGRVKGYLQSVPYDQPFSPMAGVEARLVEAGHILGSAAVALDIEVDGRDGRRTRLWFSGDIGRPALPLVRDPAPPSKADFLLMECTYGDRPHLDPQTATENLRRVVVRTVERGGKIIIPAFAVGRTQELVFSLNLMMRNGEVPRIPVIVDSPLAVNVSDIFREHSEYFDQETLDFMRSNNGASALGFDLLTYVRSVEESKAINQRKEPMVIISASGMAESGRILHHLRHNIGDARNTILIVSYQARNTLGRRLAEGERRVRIFGDTYERKAEVVALDGFSAHAGQDALLDYARATKDSLQQVFLVHGEPPAAEALRGKLREEGIEKVVVPYLRQSVEI